VPIASSAVSISAAHADAFYSESSDAGEVWTVRDDGGFLAPETADGVRAMPFWSKRSRAERVVSAAPAYAGFKVVAVPLDVFRQRWLPGLARDGPRRSELVGRPGNRVRR
jgi:hypothetical protein